MKTCAHIFSNGDPLYMPAYISSSVLEQCYMYLVLLKFLAKYNTTQSQSAVTLVDMSVYKPFIQCLILSVTKCYLFIYIYTVYIISASHTFCIKIWDTCLLLCRLKTKGFTEKLA